MKIALCQTNAIVGDIEGNKQKILAGYREAGKKADIVLFPELALPGYPPLDLVEKQEFRDAVSSAMNEIAAATGDTALLFGSIVETNENIGTNLYNAAVLCFEGAIQFVQSKTLIPNYDVFDEMRYFESARVVSVFPFRGEKIGISVCEDIWNDGDYWKHRLYMNDPVEQLISQGATLLLNISASPYSYGKRRERQIMLSTLCRHDRVPLAYCCSVGAQTELIFDGASMCFDSAGNLVKLGKSFSEDTVYFDTKESYPAIAESEGDFEAEVLDALTLGLRDYCKKLGFGNVLLGLSGGIDSAIVACIAVRALGPEHVHAVMLPSLYSSEGSITDSEELIRNLGIHSLRIDIQPAVDTLLASLKDGAGISTAGITEENIQSRARGVLLMALANKNGHLLLTTGNKSELATGYCTLYGDMSGGLAVIADIYKTDIYRLARYINSHNEVIPAAILTKAPSAELRPNQTDQDSLPPYELLDDVLRLYLEKNFEKREITKQSGNEATVEKILRLVDLSEFKRKQSAPALRVSYKAFGYGRRYPIVQGWRK